MAAEVQAAFPRVTRADAQPWWGRFFAPIDGASLAVFRITFGAIMLVEVFRYFSNGWVRSYYIDPIFHFAYYGFGWVKPWPGHGMYWHFAVIGLASAGVMLGAWYRFCAVLLFVTFSYVFLLDQAYYLNHFYMICLVSLLMIFIPANRVLSMDARRKPAVSSDDVPAWARWLLLAQLSIVYFYAGVAKLNGDWLQGEPMRSWLAERVDLPLIGRFFVKEWVVLLFNYGGLAFDLFIVPLLLWKRTRLVAFLWVIAFHLFNMALFNIGIFPWLMLLATLLFFPPNWPRVVFKRWRRVCKAPLVDSPGFPRVTVGLIAAYTIIQLVVPLRHFMYGGSVHWTEEGHRFSWHMKLRDKVATAHFFVTDPLSRQTWEVAPELYLTDRQTRKMSTRPDMILQLAHHIARGQAAKRGLDRPLEVRARVVASLHGRDQQLLVDPTVNLAAERRSLGPATWILPLDPTR